MAKLYPVFEYSMHDVRRAGEVLAGSLTFDGQVPVDVVQAFRIANNFRDAHAFPMRSVRMSLVQLMRARGIKGITAARLKRMQAIRRKLRRIRLNFNQLQDLGGVRVILPSIADVRAMTEAFREHTGHEIRSRDDDYISFPKPDGYRSHHIKIAYRGQLPVHDGRRVEIQFRTRLQHSWATAVEAVGLFRGEDLKANQGSEHWLRLFQLLSAEFAEAEACPVADGLPEARLRRKEIKELDAELDASATLDSISRAVDYTEMFVQPLVKPTHYLILFDNQTKTVMVRPQTLPTYAVAEYDNAEAMDNATGADRTNVVLVEVDKVSNLKKAYPNYFGDVQLFADQLTRLCKGKAAIEYTMHPQARVAPPPREKPDLSWMTRPRFNRPR